jgi:hypothetical protein
MGMKEKLVRTDEENIRHKQLVNINRQKKVLLKQKEHEKLLSIPPVNIKINYFLILNYPFFF